MTSRDFPDEMVRGLIELDRLARVGVPHVPPRKVVADFVRMQRAILGWKQDTLASFAQVSLSTIQRVERSDKVSAKSLDRVAVALHQKPGAFHKPRVPLTLEQLGRRLDESAEPFKGTTPIPVRPLRNQPQIAELPRCDTYLIDGGELGDACEDEIAALGEYLDFVSFVLATEDKESIIQTDRRQRIKRRQLYTMVLDQVREIERRSNAVALAGTYQAQTESVFMPTIEVAVIRFFPKLSDPGAIKRRTQFAPIKVSWADAWRRFCQIVDEEIANTSTAT